MGADSADLMCASTALAGSMLTHYETQFEQALADAIAASPVAAFYAASHFTPADVARTLHATARGLKASSHSRQEFILGMTVAARMCCANLERPLDQERKNVGE